MIISLFYAHANKSYDETTYTLNVNTVKYFHWIAPATGKASMQTSL